MRVILVDDEEELVSTLAERLSLRGIQADWATSCEGGLKLVEKEAYDLAVLDIKLPRMSGLELKKRFQKKCPDMKFIFMTGHGSEDDFLAASAETGADYYLVKPVQITALIEKMNKALAK
ncbi:MAG: response regulator [Thermodesulfobacteriota bacterium]|nr:response regulator [Thermodesulfobacteriota bacterium]